MRIAVPSAQNETMLSDLIAHPDVCETMRLAGPVGMMAIHGGVERHTDSIAHAVADRTGASRYVVTQPPELGWHIPSTSYDPGQSPALEKFLARVGTVVSIHGFGREHLRRSVLIGGANVLLKEQMAEAIGRHTALDVVTGDQIPRGLRGMHPSNPVNFPRGGGVQLELSHSCRVPPHVEPLIAAVVEVVAHAQAR